MRVKFTILAVCATLMQISLAQRSPSSSEIRSEAVRDWAILGAYGGAATFEAEKAIQRIFDIERLGYATIAGLESAGANVESSYSENNCIDSILIVWRGTMNATLDGALTVNPPASSGLITARAIGYKTLPSLVESLCGAMKLALTDKSCETSTQIQAMADKEISGAATYNAAVFAAVQTGITFPTNIEAAALKAQKKSTDAISSSLQIIFDSIKTFLVNTSSENQTRVEDVYSAMEAVQNQAQSDFNLYIKINFDFFRSLSLASYIIQDGTIIDFSSTAAIDGPATCNCRKPVDSNFPQCTSDSSGGAPEDQSEMTDVFCRIQANREKQLSEFINGLEIIFTIIKSKLADLDSGNQSVRKTYSHDDDQAEIETFLAMKAAADAVLSAAKIISQESSSAIETYRSQIYDDTKNVVGITYDAIRLAYNEDSSKIVTQMEAFEKEIMRRSANVGSNLSMAILNGHKDYFIIGSAIARALEEVSSKCIIIFQNVADAIKILLAATFRGIYSEIEPSTSAIEVRREDALSKFKTVNDLRFFMIETLWIVDSSRDNSDIFSNFSAIQSTYEIRISGRMKIFEIIFTTIGNTMAKVPSGNEGASEDDKRDIEIAREETYALFRTSIDSAIDIIYIVNPRAVSAVRIYRNPIYSLLIRFVDDIYATILLAYGNDSSEIDSTFKGHRNSAISIGTDIMARIYEPLINFGTFPARIKAAIQRTFEDSTRQVVKATVAVYDAIEILLAKAFPGRITSSEDSSSSIEDVHMDAHTAATNQIQNEANLGQIATIATVEERVGLTADSCPAGATDTEFP